MTDSALLLELARIRDITNRVEGGLITEPLPVTYSVPGFSVVHVTVKQVELVRVSRRPSTTEIQRKPESSCTKLTHMTRNFMAAALHMGLIAKNDSCVVLVD